MSLPRIDSDEALLDAIEAAGAPAGAWVASDADGTLWAADVAEIAWHRAVGERRLRPAAAPAMRALVEGAGAESRGDVHDDARLAWELYLTDRIDDWGMLAAMAFCFAGWRTGELVDLGREVAGALAPRVYATTAPLLAALHARGHPLAVISGSPRVLVEEAVRALDLPGPVAVLGVELAVEGDVLGDRVVDPVTWEDGKVDALRAHAAGAGAGEAIAVAFGDTGGDLPLLRAASALRVLVHPRPGLRALARGEGGPWCEFAPARTVGGDDVRPPETDRVIEG